MNTLTIEETAKRINQSEDEVKRMLKNGSLESVEVPGSVPQVSEKSVCQFLGEEYVEPEDTPKRRGRQPKVLSYDEAAELLGLSAVGVDDMAFEERLEAWELPDGAGTGVTNRSVQKFIVEMSSDKEEEESTVIEDTPEVRAAAQAQINEEIEAHEDATTDEKPTEDLPPPVKKIAQEAGTVKMLEPHEKLSDFYPQKIIPVPGMYTSDDLQAAAKIARMEGELDAYRSMQSFERRA